MQRIFLTFLTYCVSVLFIITTSSASVSEYTDYTAWQQAAGSYSTLDFTGLGQFVVVSTQYSHLGVTFTDGDNATYGPYPKTFHQDGWGLHPGSNEHIMVELSAPAYVFAAHHPGTIQFRLFLDDAVVYTSAQFQGSHSGYDGFSGIISTIPFNRVRIWDWVDHLVIIDNIYVNVPGPGALSVFVIAVMFGGLRRRRS